MIGTNLKKFTPALVDKANFMLNAAARHPGGSQEWGKLVFSSDVMTIPTDQVVFLEATQALALKQNQTDIAQVIEKFLARHPKHNHLLFQLSMTAKKAQQRIKTFFEKIIG